MKLSTKMFKGDYSFLVVVKILKRKQFVLVVSYGWNIMKVYNICDNNKSEIYNVQTFHDRLHFAISVIS